jgi:hypothetical protein
MFSWISGGWKWIGGEIGCNQCTELQTVTHSDQCPLCHNGFCESDFIDVEQYTHTVPRGMFSAAHLALFLPARYCIIIVCESEVCLLCEAGEYDSWAVCMADCSER